MGFAARNPSRVYLAGLRTIHDVALEMTREALGLADDFANGIIARQIVELARAGERNPDLLCEGALKKLRGACSETNETRLRRSRSKQLAVLLSGDFVGSGTKPDRPTPRFRTIQVCPKDRKRFRGILSLL
jgi:hypothetical protein